MTLDPAPGSTGLVLFAVLPRLREICVKEGFKVVDDNALRSIAEVCLESQKSKVLYPYIAPALRLIAELSLNPKP